MNQTMIPRTGTEALESVRPLWQAPHARWFTIALAVTVYAGYGAVLWAAAQEYLSLWAGMLLNSLFAYVGFTIMHEAVHGNIAGARSRLSKIVEDILGWIGGILLLSPYPAFKVLHLRHHAHTNDPVQDADYWVAGRNPFTVFWKLVTIRISYDRKFLQLDNIETSRRVICTSALAICVLIMVLLGLEYGAAYPLMLCFAPSVIALTVLALVFIYMPHHPHTTRDRYYHTAILLGPGIPTMFLGQNYHLVHHLYPSIPFYLCGEAFRRVRPFLEAQGCLIRRVYHLSDWRD